MRSTQVCSSARTRVDTTTTSKQALLPSRDELSKPWSTPLQVAQIS